MQIIKRKQKLLCVNLDIENIVLILEILGHCTSSRCLGNLRGKWSQFDFDYYTKKSMYKESHFQVKNRTSRVYVVGKQELFEIYE